MFWCSACSFLGFPSSPDLLCNGFSYNCKTCDIDLDVQCSLTLDILTHKGHQHRLILSSTNYLQSYSSCGSKSNQVFRCFSCEFALDYKCATLSQTTRYKQHEHSFTLSYTIEHDFGEYYCNICEEERNPNHWFYFCVDCTYPAHPKCILEKYPNFKFGGAYTFGCHQHPLTFIEETEDAPPYHICSRPCKELIYQCVPWLSTSELEHSPAAEDVTIVGLLVVFQFEMHPANLTKGLIDLKSQVESIIYNQCFIRAVHNFSSLMEAESPTSLWICDGLWLICFGWVHLGVLNNI
ncbi:hypothetical protein CFP56_008657 [Quercus suber]|uniref:DC1 domain-containing protein n=1 Tax=Quercus suber TaxID=58331 RepID=A0AAW0M639_QUESU